MSRSELAADVVLAFTQTGMRILTFQGGKGACIWAAAAGSSGTMDGCHLLFPSCTQHGCYVLFTNAGCHTVEDTFVMMACSERAANARGASGASWHHS
jgi:hypothetical protein